MTEEGQPMGVSKQSITVGTRGVGSISIDGASVTGERGGLHPQLVIPLTIELDSRMRDSKIAVTSLRAELGTDQYVSPQKTVGAPVSEALLNGFPVTSQTQAPGHRLDLRFQLSFAEVEHLERQRQASRVDGLSLYLRLQPVVSAMRVHNELQPGQVPAATSWSATELGMFAELFPFWYAQIPPLEVVIETSTWVNQVLPALGYDQLRLVEIRFPPPLPNHQSAAGEWDKARRALDEGRYGDAVSECRDVLSMWKNELKATNARPVALVIAEQHGWSEADPRRAFLDGLWKATVDLANSTHHPEGQSEAQQFLAEDARLMLLLTASLSEYVSHTT
jgi:hypothetical protein